jgi:hypothetical protein
MTRHAAVLAAGPRHAVRRIGVWLRSLAMTSLVSAGAGSRGALVRGAPAGLPVRQG